mmetsp:Transcript_18113/g.51556  ORF Transcript_18113/g.51556 Transcript_18113/m.51556 type:complete len:112 (+) Transcript_18113:53-388(+)
MFGGDMYGYGSYQDQYYGEAYCRPPPSFHDDAYAAASESALVDMLRREMARMEQQHQQEKDELMQRVMQLEDTNRRLACLTIRPLLRRSPSEESDRDKPRANEGNQSVAGG